MIQHTTYVIGDGRSFLQHETLKLLSVEDLCGQVLCVASKQEAFRLLLTTGNQKLWVFKTDAETPLEELVMVAFKRGDYVAPPPPQPTRRRRPRIGV